MDEKKIIKKYICPGAWMTVAGILLAVVMAASMVMGVMTRNADYGEAVEFYPGQTPTETMAYIDVVGISDWLLRSDDKTYYSVEDAEGYLYTVRLSDSQFDELEKYRAYWERESDDVPVPEAYRLEGYVQETSSEVRADLAGSWSITELEYHRYFGDRHLDATTSVGEERSVVWTVAAVFSGVFAAACLVLVFRAGANARKCLARLEERNLLEKAARELELPEGNTVIARNKATLTQSFLFGRGTGVVVAYDDILWAYQMDRRRGLRVANSYLMVGTAFMEPKGAIDMNRSDRFGYLGDAIAIIVQRNPRILLGFTNENRKAYRAMVKGR